MWYTPNMYQIKSLENARRVFLGIADLLGIGKEGAKAYFTEKPDIYAVGPRNFDICLRHQLAVRNKIKADEVPKEDLKDWKYLFKGLGWLVTSKGRFTTQRRFNGSKAISVIGIDKDKLELLKAMEPPEKAGAKTGITATTPTTHTRSQAESAKPA